MTDAGVQRAVRAAGQLHPGQEGEVGAKRRRRGKGSQAHDAQGLQAAKEGGTQQRQPAAAAKHKVCLCPWMVHVRCCAWLCRQYD